MEYSSFQDTCPPLPELEQFAVTESSSEIATASSLSRRGFLKGVVGIATLALGVSESGRANREEEQQHGGAERHEDANEASYLGTESVGGSNLAWFHMAGCTREPYGVVGNYHIARDKIQRQLQEMRANGQQRLRIPLYTANLTDIGGQDTGTVMNSAGGNLSDQNRENLTNLLADIKAAGFAEILVSMHPQSHNDPSSPDYNPANYTENRDLIYNLRPIIAAAGLNAKIDLLNEGIPGPGQTALLNYTKQLWADYTARYGTNDTIGFSAIGSEPARLARMKEVYGTNPPPVFDMHFYGNSSQNEYTQFVNANRLVEQQGFGKQGWIIGESFYNDKMAAANFKKAIKATGRLVYYLLQWPLRRKRACSNVDVASPTAYNNYS